MIFAATVRAVPRWTNTKNSCWPTRQRRQSVTSASTPSRPFYCTLSPTAIVAAKALLIGRACDAMLWRLAIICAVSGVGQRAFMITYDCSRSSCPIAMRRGSDNRMPIVSCTTGECAVSKLSACVQRDGISIVIPGPFSRAYCALPRALITNVMWAQRVCRAPLPKNRTISNATRALRWRQSSNSPSKNKCPRQIATGKQQIKTLIHLIICLRIVTN